MIINLLTPRIRKNTFTGGIFCILKYAHGLSQKGHTVNIIPFPASEKPAWIECEANFLFCPAPALPAMINVQSVLTYVIDMFDYLTFRVRPASAKYVLNERLNFNNVPEADFTIATSWETALLAHTRGTGVKAYFAQHYEPLFSEPNSAESAMSEQSYLLPLVKIANSSWLQNEFSKRTSDRVYKCLNAVDLDTYLADSTENAQQSSKDTVSIISYGGRDALWKGFPEMAAAMSIAKKKLPQLEITWNVYGGSVLPPQNDICCYNDLGFKSPPNLAVEYQKNSILLSASWYESFPLFPIEAMASGLAVITTAKGTEDYAIHGDTAYVVEEKSVDSIANGIVDLCTDHSLRQKISTNGYSKAQEFSWQSSVDNMEKTLQEIQSAAEQEQSSTAP